jgi:hypothetical protein
MAETKTIPDDFDADTKLRMWTATVALQGRGPNQSFEGALKNAAQLYDYLRGGGAPIESTLKVVKTL